MAELASQSDIRPQQTTEAATRNGPLKPKKSVSIDEKPQLVPMPKNYDKLDSQPPLPLAPHPQHGRAPVYYVPTGYADLSMGKGEHEDCKFEHAPLHITPDAEEHEAKSKSIELELQPHLLTEEQFNELAENLRIENGKYVVMTAYGSVVVPDEVLAHIPKEFKLKPIQKEHKTFVPKTKQHDRFFERHQIQHKHHFVHVPTSGVVNKFVPNGKEETVEIRRYVYKPVTEKRLVDLPLGFRYIETPLDVYMKKPPVLLPVSEKLYIERHIRKTRPVIKEKVVEVPKQVIKYVDTPVEKEIKYLVPKYVEQYIDVPYEPNMKLPTPSGTIHTEIPTVEDAKRYIDALNSEIDKQQDRNLVIGPDGVYCRLAEDGKSLQSMDGKALFGEDNEPIVIDRPNPRSGLGKQCSIVEDTLVIDALDEDEMYIEVPEGVNAVAHTEDYEIEEVTQLDNMDKVHRVEDGLKAKVVYAGKPLHYVPEYVTPGLERRLDAEQSHPVARADNAPEYVKQNATAVCAVPLEPVVEVGVPGMRTVNYEIEQGDAAVLTRFGELSERNAALLSCGNPAKLMVHRLHGSRHAPLTAEGTVDLEKLEEIQKEYIKRANFALQMPAGPKDSAPQSPK